MITTKKIAYRDNNITLEGFYAYDDSHTNKRPAVLVAHDWSGRNKNADNNAIMLAELGYVGFAIDMYGEGKIGQSTDEKKSLMMPLLNDRHLLFQRIASAFHFLKTLDYVDGQKIGAIGFCFGGLCVLDLARHAVDVAGVVSFHGLLNSPPSFEIKAPLKTKILVLHGHDDPMVTPEDVITFEKEMTKAKADWQVHVYSNTKHAFTNPEAHDDNFGTVYNKQSAERSYLAMQNFFTEIFR